MDGPAPAPARIADRYEVLRPLGRGGFAHTLLARDTALGRPVALKILHPQTAQDWKAYELFEREASVLKELRHPGIPVIHLALEAEWQGAKAAILVMEYVEGETIADLIAQQRRLDPDDVLNLFVEMLGVLDYLHTRVPPILHRDLKPANIIVRPGGTPALVDFGAVRSAFLNPDEPSSTVVGTYGYMPYEQTMGQASPSSDLYGLAATFLHLLTGRSPADFMDGDARIAVPEPLPCGEPMRGILARMLRPTPSERYQTAREVRTALLGGTASAPAAGPGAALAALDRPLPVELPPTPRAIAGPMKTLYRQARYSTWEIINSDGEGSVEAGVMDIVLIVFFGVLTAGIVPAVFLSRALARRRKVKPFIVHGLPAVGEVLELAVEKIEFDARLMRVRYAFEADGRRRLGTDRVIPGMADQWEVGSEVRVLYLPDREYQSIVVGSH